MFNSLINHIRKYVSITDDDILIIKDCFVENKFRKKVNLIEESNVCNQQFFVSKGCLRMFFTNEKGVEHTVQFAIENWWLSDFSAFENKSLSDFSIQAVEDSDVLIINYESQKELLQKVPILERYFRLVFQRAYSASMLRTKYLFDFSREEFYLHFYNSFPEFTSRIPQQYLASYLNMTPEYLSEIKKKLKS